MDNLDIVLRGTSRVGERPTAEEILTQDIFGSSSKRAIVLYDANGVKEIYLDEVLANKIVQDFCSYNVCVETTDRMRHRHFHTEYRVSYIQEARNLLEGTCGVVASKEFLDLLEELLVGKGDLVVWRYEMLTEERSTNTLRNTKRAHDF